jgi:hypothetical protein
MATGRILFKNLLRYCSFAGVYFDGTFGFVVAVAERRTSWVRPCRRFEVHPLHDLFPLVLDVVFGYREANVVHEFQLRFGILGKYVPFFDEVDYRPSAGGNRWIVALASKMSLRADRLINSFSSSRRS